MNVKDIMEENNEKIETIKKNDRSVKNNLKKKNKKSSKKKEVKNDKESKSKNVTRSTGVLPRRSRRKVFNESKSVYSYFDDDKMSKRRINSVSDNDELDEKKDKMNKKELQDYKNRLEVKNAFKLIVSDLEENIKSDVNFTQIPTKADIAEAKKKAEAKKNSSKLQSKNDVSNVKTNTKPNKNISPTIPNANISNLEKKNTSNVNLLQKTSGVKLSDGEKKIKSNEKSKKSIPNLDDFSGKSIDKVASVSYLIDSDLSVESSSDENTSQEDETSD
uniref:Pru domain-containing protein n=1 Tax=Strongyloides stercoralis TaxID=6248 RepID=A0A0K0E601_STRER